VKPPGEPDLAALRERGAHRSDPVGFAHLEALDRRAQAHGGEVRQLLDRKLRQALTACAARFERARAEADSVLADAVQRFPHAARECHERHADGDFGGLRRLVARLEAADPRGPLPDLVDHLGRQSPAPDAAAGGLAAAEPKALRQFRRTWARLSVDRQLARSLQQAPENPGPLNSQRLVLRALRCMQDISPAYLEHFVSHVETLLWLDRAQAGPAPPPARRGGREIDKPPKPGRRPR
jgi:hypothetical protein